MTAKGKLIDLAFIADTHFDTAPVLLKEFEHPHFVGPPSKRANKLGLHLCVQGTVDTWSGLHRASCIGGDHG